MDKHISCLQDFYIGLNQQEDCLITDVFVPDINQTNLPVMVSVHGGGYQTGFGSMMSFRSFSEMKNIIVVTFNYRLSTQGFLCLGTENIPGNAGIKDQVALLRWVNRNIANFGGNPNDVTVIGCSAGGSSVDLLTVSSITKGLFQKVIVDSSAHLSPYSVQIDPIGHAKIHARRLNFTNLDDIVALENFYLDTPWDVLLHGTATVFNENIMLGFTPCIEKDFGQERFLDDAPFNIISRGDNIRYPMIYGFTDLEGLLFLKAFYEWKSRMNEKFSDFLPGDLEFENDDIKEEVGRQAKATYFNNLPVNNNTIMNFLNYYMDTQLVYSILRSVEIQNQIGNTNMYLHYFKFYDENSAPVPDTDYRGATHCSQMFIVTDSNETNVTEEWLNMKSLMTDIYYNFVTTG